MKNKKFLFFAAAFLLFTQSNTFGECVLPAVPTDVKALAESAKSIKISWTAAKNADSYEVYRSLFQNMSYSRIAAVSSNSYIDKKGIALGKTYYYKVKSKNKCGLSENSDYDFAKIVDKNY